MTGNGMDAMHTEEREHRLVMRMLTKWRALANGNDFPRRSQVDPLTFGEDWAHCFLIDVDPVPERSRFSFLGANLADPSWPIFERQCVSDCVDGTLLRVATSYIGRVVARRAPISVGGAALHFDVPILYRSILLPLSERGDAVDGILGAANYREILETEEIHLPMMATTETAISR
jgi:hypothetical protein